MAMTLMTSINRQWRIKPAYMAGRNANDMMVYDVL